MDIIASRKDLLRLVARCQGVADKKSAIPALHNVLLSATDSILRVAATDLYLGISGSTVVTVKTPGSIALPAKDLLDRVKAMPDGEIQLTVNGDAQASLKAVGSPRRYTLSGIPGSEFPKLPEQDPDAPILELSADLLAGLIARVHFSISADETRAHVNSALFEWTEKFVRMVSTDGRRLSKAEVTLVTEHDEQPAEQALQSMLIPLKAVLELKRLVDDASATKGAKVQIAQHGPNAFFAVAGMVFSVKTIDAQFPPYMQVIPAKSTKIATVPRAAFADAARAVALAANERTGGVKLSLVSGSLRIMSETPDVGEGFDMIDVDYSGEEVTIGFNSKYLLDVLAACDGDEVLLGLSDELDPAVIRPAKQGTGDDFLGVLMPMRL
jgi:DNA polymerase III subunit beta